MDIIYKKVQELIPYENNPRLNKEAVSYVANSIKEFGFKNPIIIDKDNVIVAGHTRLLASKRLGLKEVPCIVADDLTDEQIKAFRLADNKTAEFAEWDMDMLLSEIEGIEGLDMTAFGFEEIENEEKEVVEDNYEEPEELEPTAKRGDIYQLGDHRLMCGDSTSADDVQELMNGCCADILYTDPPYNVNVENSQGMKIENDNMSEQAFNEFLGSAFRNASMVLKEGGAFYVWHADSESIAFRQNCEDNDLQVKQCLIWVKNGFNFGRQDYKWQHEPCLYGWKKGAGHYFIEEFNHSTVIEDNIDVDKLKKDELKALLKQILSTKVPTTVVHENKPVKNELHPTMKPLKMCANMIRNSSRPKEIVLDLFGGSGSTLMCAEQLGRTCYMMEYDPHYVDVIIDRWEQFTGQEAVKIK